MDFDHIEDKSFNISSALNLQNFEDIKKEIEKCEVVCSNCHRSRTYNRLLRGNSSTYDISEFYN